MNKNYMFDSKCLALVSVVLLNTGWVSFSAHSQTLDSSNSGLEEVIVTAEFGDVSPLELATSVTLFDDSDIYQRGAQHLEQLLNLAPNVNYASGASRGRFIQIRGIGERGQFAEPLIASVGVLIDGIDFTGISTAATTLDIQQVEILRGPQGTLYGANALAGLINLVSNKPTKQTTGSVSVTAGNYDARVLSGVVSGPVSDQVGYRVAMQNNKSNGYIENDTLGRDDTNGIDETTMRGKIVWNDGNNISVDLTAFYSDVDNNYDSFSLDQNRTTLSDDPGQDKQKTKAASVTTIWTGSRNFELETLLSHADSDIDYGFDEDWSPISFVGDFGGYSSFDRYLRDRQNTSIDIRLLSKDQGKFFNGSTSWVAGIYGRTQSVDLLKKRTGDPTFTSQFETDNLAAYTQLRGDLSERLVLAIGLRFEQRGTDYKDSDSGSFSPNEDLWGGKISLEYLTNNDSLLYATLSRGYKSGGVNSNSALAVELRDYETEFLLNYELGIKGQWLDSKLIAQLVVFYQDRKDVQVEQSVFEPNTFAFNDFLDNSAGGNTSGVELELTYQIHSSIQLFTTVGLLDAEFDDFSSTAHVDARNDFTGEVFDSVNLGGRDLAHAPNYQYVVGGLYNLSDTWYVKIDIEGKDAYFFSNSHNMRSDSYTLLNASIGYKVSNVEVSLWGRNLSNKDYAVRGFFFSNQFGNDPRDGYAPHTYVQYGEPRVVGITARYNF